MHLSEYRPGHLGSLASPIAIGGPLFGTFAGPAHWWSRRVWSVACMLPAKRADPRFFRDTDAGRWSAPARSCRGCLFTLGITARDDREKEALTAFSIGEPDHAETRWFKDIWRTLAASSLSDLADH